MFLYINFGSMQGSCGYTSFELNCSLHTISMHFLPSVMAVAKFRSQCCTVYGAQNFVWLVLDPMYSVAGHFIAHVQMAAIK